MVGVQAATHGADRPIPEEASYSFPEEASYSFPGEDPRYPPSYYEVTHEEATQVYLVEMQQGNEKFLKIGISDNSIRMRFYEDLDNGNLDSIERVRSIVFTERKDALLAEKRLLEASRKYHYEPARSFGGSARECRSLRIKGWLIKSMISIGADAYKHGKIFDGNFMR